MAKITVDLVEPPQLTVDAIYKFYEDNAESWDSLGINVGDLGKECSRELYYNLHWATHPEKVKGRNKRLMETGNLEEPRFENDLRNIGVEVYGAQDRIRLVAGHVRGKRDGAAMGLLEAPKTEHLLEFKTSNTKNFKKLLKEGLQKAKPEHYGQCQLGCHFFGLTRCMYLVKNKDDELIHSIRIEYDAVYCLQLLAKAESIVRATSPPARISEDPAFFGCMFCKHKAVCHEDALPRVTCRSCLWVTPQMTGDATWECGKFNKPLSFDEQKEACNSHLYDPDLVSAEQIDSDEVAETVTYRLKTGEIWVDGSGVAPGKVAA
jgi:hypothetical protein